MQSYTGKKGFKHGAVKCFFAPTVTHSHLKRVKTRKMMSYNLYFSMKTYVRLRRAFLYTLRGLLFFSTFHLLAVPVFSNDLQFVMRHFSFSGYPNGVQQRISKTIEQRCRPFNPNCFAHTRN